MEIENGNTFTPKKPPLIEKAMCPYCSEIIKINQRNNLLISNGSNEQQKILESNEFLNINCSKCCKNFTFINCFYCNEKIMMKIHPLSKVIEYNGISGFNIRCPYKSCNKIFYFTECPKCKTPNKINKLIKEGDIIICQNENCKFQYLEVNCPYKLCPEKNWAQRPINYTNFQEGIIFPHNKLIIYQKISCNGCFRPICFPSTREKKNKYIEGQKVVCPYPDCQKIFNRLICPNCTHANYIEQGWYEYGTEIKCNLCKENFGKILCPKIGKLSSFKENYFEFGEIVCAQNCKKTHNMMNCLFCRQLNIFEEKVQLICRRIKCGYCSKIFGKIYCPHCSKVNPFPFGDFFFGKLYKCQYFNCLKEFQYLLCPKCETYSTMTIKKEGQKFQCSKCNTIYMNFGCIFCKLNILAQDATLKIGQLIRCPSPKCNKVFSFMQCHKCEKLIYSQENENIYGKSKRCTNPNCREYTIMTLCPLCKKRVLYHSRHDIEENQNIRCENCKKNYTFHRKNNLYKGTLKIYEEIEGKAFNFGKGEIDENYKVKEELLFSRNFLGEKNGDLNLLNGINNNKYFGVCILCNNHKKQSVFFPCGHRCACYRCANLYFSANKKCPRCHQDAKCVIGKIFE